MSVPMFSWLYGDPAESIDRLRALRSRMEKAEAEFMVQERRRKARRIRKLVKLAKARLLKGQK